LFLESKNDKLIIVPFFDGHKGHPWLVHRFLWGEILALCPPLTAGDFLNQHESQIDYVDSDSSILDDFDTPAEYSRLKQKTH